MGEFHGEGEGNDDVKILGETNGQQNTTAAALPPPSSVHFNGSDFISTTDLPPSPEKQFSTKMADEAKFISPHANLPQPETPPGIFLVEYRSSPDDSPIMPRSTFLRESFTNNVPAIGKYFKERSSSLSSAISKIRISPDAKPKNVTEINLAGMKVIVKSKNGFRNDGADEGKIKGRVTFFSRSNCRDCTAVRTFFREKGLKFVEINVDVYPNREKELIKRTGNSSVPKIFFNEKMFGGLVALNSLRNSGQFDERVREMLTAKCPDDAPAAPVYGFDDEEDGDVETDQTDEVVREIVRVLRMKLPIQDRFIKMVRLERNCFAGSEVVEVIIHHLDCGRRKAVEVGKMLARKHFIHHVSGENDFEDGNYLYRFLEHEPFIPRCYNFRGSTNDSEPKSAALVSQRLAKIMSAILESYSSEDRRHVDYMGISNSEEFRRYTILVQELHRLDLQTLSADEHLVFFLNLYNAMVIHALIRIGHPEGLIDRRSFFSDFLYVVGGYPYSLSAIENGILRNNRKPPYTLTKPFNAEDRRLELAVTKVNPLIHFGLCNGTRSSPTVRFFTPNGIETQLRTATREFFQKGGIEFDLEKRTVYISRIIKWFSADFCPEKEILKWIMNYLDATKAGLLTHLMSDGEHNRIIYRDYDWSANS